AMNKFAGIASVLQAIWTILAVIVAIVFPRLEAGAQADENYRRQKRLLQRLVLNAESLLTAAAQYGADQPGAGNFVAGTTIAKWEAARDALNAYPVVSLKEAEEVEDLIAVRSAIGEATQHIARCKTGVLTPNGATGAIATLMERDAAA